MGVADLMPLALAGGEHHQREGAGSLRSRSTRVPGRGNVIISSHIVRRPRVPGGGIEPPSQAPKARVLPLDHPGARGAARPGLSAPGNGCAAGGGPLVTNEPGHRLGQALGVDQVPTRAPPTVGPLPRHDGAERAGLLERPRSSRAICGMTRAHGRLQIVEQRHAQQVDVPRLRGGDQDARVGARSPGPRPTTRTRRGVRTPNANGRSTHHVDGMWTGITCSPRAGGEDGLAGEQRRDVGPDPGAHRPQAARASRPAPHSSFSTRSVAAASALPPPMPAATGIRLSISIAAPAASDRAPRRPPARAAAQRQVVVVAGSSIARSPDTCTVSAPAEAGRHAVVQLHAEAPGSRWRGSRRPDVPARAGTR